MRGKRIDTRTIIGIALLVFVVVGLIVFNVAAKKYGLFKKDDKNALVTKTTVNKELTVDEQIEEYIKNFGERDGKDVTAPLILSGANTTVKVGAERVPDPGIAIDDYDTSIEFTYEGEYDLSKEGTYEIVRIATDDAGNSTRQNVTLRVVAELPEIEEPKRMATLKISDAIKKYKTNDEIEVGIDVSRWQGDINWDKVKSAGVSFVFIRLGVQDGLKGEYYVDRNFVKYFKGAQEAGLKVGVYFYTYAISKEDGANDAKFVYETLKENNFKPDLPIAFDWESFGSITFFRTSLNDLNDALHMFQGVLETAGYSTCLYNSKYYLSSGVWEDPDNNNLWLAQYSSEPTYEGKYFVWQCSNTGSVPGIVGDVDIDIMYSSPKEKTR